MLCDMSGCYLKIRENEENAENLKTRIGEQFLKTVRKWVFRKNLPFSHQCPKIYRKSEKMFQEFLINSEEISKKVWENF